MEQKDALEEGEAFGFKAGVSRRLQGRKGSAARSVSRGVSRGRTSWANHALVVRSAAGGITALAEVAGVAPRLPPLGSRRGAKQRELSASELRWNRPRNGRARTAGQQWIEADERRMASWSGARSLIQCSADVR